MKDKNLFFLETIFTRSADGLMICDGQGRILKMNQAAERLNGIKASEVAGKDVRTLVKEGQINRSATQEVLETRRQVSLVQTTPKSGYSLLVTGTPVFNDAGDIAFVVVNERDISLIRDMKRKLAQVRQESEKMREELTELTLRELEDNNIVAKSPSMKQAVHLALKLARIDASNILLQGESGTGKGLLAKFIHKHSLRAGSPFIQINCAALPENLLEAELFGYEKGAFTGARETGKAGLFELAAGGTLFLDEIGELSPGVQAKLLKYLDDQEIMPVGGTKSKKIDCSILAATNQDLEQLTRKKQFRLDLLHRLNTFTLTIPPLRNRPEDILELTRLCLKRYNKKYNRRAHIGYKALQALKAHSFHGNVRELINMVKQAVAMCDRRQLDDYLIRFTEAPENPVVRTGNMGTCAGLAQAVQAVEHDMLMQAAMRCRTTREAAAFLGTSQPTVVRKFKKHGIVLKS
ncbi:MAG TPA: sigma 54-interacting transcriptional regulator [Desulfotignum sp.]|nr:sigma 54-interacting transcriptional regulator [Desulfotignum sp.]